MPMNTIIKEKRKEIGLTQEKIAEYLGVSTPAVNKWEKGVTSPDIALLPPLARLLEVDLNTLLCFNDGLSEQEIMHFMRKLSDSILEKGIEHGFTIGLEKIREYPSCGLLIHNTALALDGALLMSGLSVNNKKKYQKEIVSLYERAVDCGNEEVRDSALFMLASKYISDMDFEKAQEILDLLPERSAIDKRNIQANLYIEQNKLEEAAGILERKLLTGVNNILSLLSILANIECKQGNYENASRRAEICKQVTRLFDLWEYNAFMTPLQVALAKEDVNESILLLDSMISAATKPWDLGSSSLYQHIKANENKEDADQPNVKEEKVYQQMLAVIIAEIKKDPQFSILHSHPEFQKILERYQDQNVKSY